MAKTVERKVAKRNDFADADWFTWPYAINILKLPCFSATTRSAAFFLNVFYSAALFKGEVAGPCSTSPSVLKREPWQGQSQERSAELKCTTQPMCVHFA